MGKAFTLVRGLRPELDSHDLLKEVLKSRYVLIPIVPPQKQERMLQEANGSLIRLTLLVVEAERYDALLNAPAELYFLAFEVILDVLGAQAPGQVARECEGDLGLDDFRKFWAERPLDSRH
jgi:hypothetical protein